MAPVGNTDRSGAVVFGYEDIPPGAGKEFLINGLQHVGGNMDKQPLAQNQVPFPVRVET